MPMHEYDTNVVTSNHLTDASVPEKKLRTPLTEVEEDYVAFYRDPASSRYNQHFRQGSIHTTSLGTL